MKEINEKELMNIVGGGLSFNGTLFNGLARAMEVIIDIGRSLGSALRRWQDGNKCPLS